MRNDKPTIVDLSLMQHDHTSAAEGGLIPKFIYLSGYQGVLEDDVICIVWTIPDGIDAVLSSGAPGCSATCEVAPTGDVECELLKGPTPIGSVDFATGDEVATFTLTTDVGVTGGDRIKVRGPSPLDATFAGLSVTLRLEIA